MSTNKTIIIIGAGLGGLLSAFYLQKRSIESGKGELTLKIVSSEVFPACSLNSTATVALRGTKKGLSPLGDKLIDSFHLVENFYQSYNPAGVQSSILKTFNHPMSANFEKTKNRFSGFSQKQELNNFISIEEKCFLFSPDVFLAWLKTQVKAEFINQVVTHIDENEITLLDKTKIGFDEIIMATGAYGSLLSDDDKIQKSKVVSGAYLEFEVSDLGEMSFCHTFDELNFVYLAQEKKLLFGSFSEEGFILAPNWQALNERYEFWQRALLGVLPAFSEAKVRVGLRQKSSKREPWNKNLKGKKHHWGLGGFYKNGYSLAFFEAEQLSHKIIRNI